MQYGITISGTVDFPGKMSFMLPTSTQACGLLDECGYELLVFSGGRTRPQLEKETGLLSEAEGMKAFAVRSGKLSGEEDRVILESWARDSMENVFFSLLAFFNKQVGGLDK